MKIERETEVRRQKWRMKVWDLLPDYKPQQNTPWSLARFNSTDHDIYFHIEIYFCAIKIQEKILSSYFTIFALNASCVIY